MPSKFDKKKTCLVFSFNSGIAFSYHRWQEQQCPASKEPVTGGPGMTTYVAHFLHRDHVTSGKTVLCVFKIAKVNT